ncbi:MAG: GNAT family N-acetyltransferase [Alphaproteobacteria bacterium]
MAAPSLADQPHSAVIMPAPADAAARILTTLTLAFVDDPAVRWMLPDPEQHLRYFPQFAQALAGSALPAGTAWIAGDCEGAALWLAPDAHPDEQALLALVEEGVAPRQQADAFAVFEEMARHHPAEPHWYLPLIGVDPSRQGRGLGSALLRRVLEACDAARSIAYLEATGPRNRLLYERHGFVAIGQIKVGNCPPITPMLRQPRTRMGTKNRPLFRSLEHRNQPTHTSVRLSFGGSG